MTQEILFRAGCEVSVKSDESLTGVVQGPSDYEGGVIVRFSKSLMYPCSTSGLNLINQPEGDLLGEGLEAEDFERWLFMQSNVMHSLPYRDQMGAYRCDALWHQRHERAPYKSRA
jgi:hypothetical protein